MIEETQQVGPDSGDDDPFNYQIERLPREITAPLAPFAGSPPPAPQWFRDALAQEPDRSLVESLGTRIELLTWGERGKPGLLLVHGNGAHADWWSFIAPLLARDFRVAALSMAGMGASDWRDSYNAQDFAVDAEVCARAAGLYDDGRAPVYVGHSFGGSQSYQVAVQQPQQMRALLVVDSAFGPVKRVVEARGEEARGRGAPKVYASLAEALARFRLAPPQPAENLFILDYIARCGLKRAPLPDGGGEGWTWRFDPASWSKFDSSRSAPPRMSISSVSTPIIHLMGEDTHLWRVRAAGDDLQPRGLTEVLIPKAHHHVMIDQPLALVAAIRTALTFWPA